MTDNELSPSPERLRCVIPGCRRTRKVVVGDRAYSEWMCGDHWRLIDKANRRAYGRVMKRWRRFRSASTVPRADRLWRWLKRAAIERATGIG